MGTYLSTPVLDKCEESGSSDPLPPEGGGGGDNATSASSPDVSWGVVDMQGWRKSMEDAHVAQTDVRPPPTRKPPPDGGGDGGAGGDPARVFAVFDGHGGPEVARFCQLYLVDVLTTRKEWNGGTMSTAGGAAEGDKVDVDVGKALVESFHAIDRMVDDPRRRDELTNLRAVKPKPGERKTLEGGAPIPPKVEEEETPAAAATPALVAEAAAAAEEEESDLQDVTVDDDAKKVESKKEEEEEEASDETKPAAAAAAEVTSGESKADAEKEDKDDGAGGGADDKDDGADNDEDSDVAVGDEAEIAAPLVGSEEDSDDEDKEEGGGEGIISTTDAMALFQKLLTMSGASGGKVSVEVQDGEEDGGGAAAGAAGEGSTASASSSSDDNSNAAAASRDADSGGGAEPVAATVVKMGGPDASQPTRIQNGRQVCNLPDHPIHAGCTSVVAVLVGKTLTVANAGDSRAVLCRAGGGTEALSFDHKPMQDREMKRITEAGGFVNQFGRVNGNLNLSRSIGDMKYKQVPGIPPCGQMITAEPDIVQVTLNEGDEFIILGCDGIWDCLTNEEAVKYVRDRIDEKNPIEIGREMLDEIVSDDPRASQGIGGDNMTIMVIDMLPHTRSYRK